MNTSTHVKCYALRRVNPFLGVLQVLETEDGRTISTNGFRWNIELRTELPKGWGSLNRENKQVAYYRYGLWTKGDGLVQWPLSPQLDKEILSSQCERVIGQLKRKLDTLPFKIIDTNELWLFDATEHNYLLNTFQQH